MSDESRVREAPTPFLADLERANDWMLGGSGVLAGMGVLRLIATADVPAAETEAEVDPGVPDREALATPGAGRLDLLNQAQVLTRWLFASPSHTFFPACLKPVEKSRPLSGALRTALT
jgi:hypothetical protein